VPGEGADLALEAADRGREQRDPRRHAGIGHRQPRGEVVAPIEHEIGAGEHFGGVVARHPPAHAPHLDLRIELAHPDFGQLRLLMPDLALAVDRLPLQVAHVDRVVIDQHQCADTRAGEVLQGWRADPAEPDQRDTGPRQRRLPRAADLGQHDMAGKALEAIRGQGHGRAYHITCAGRASGNPSAPRQKWMRARTVTFWKRRCARMNPWPIPARAAETNAAPGTGARGVGLGGDCA
jgi:hypothetical protein